MKYQGKWGFVVASVLYLIAGLAFVIWPVEMGNIVCYLLGAAMIIFGLYSGFKYFSESGAMTFRSGLAVGICSAIFGLYVLLNPVKFIELYSALFAMIIILDSVYKLQLSVELKRGAVTNWGILTILALVGVIVGVILLFDPFKNDAGGKGLFLYIGVCLLVNGIINIWALIQFRKVLRSGE